MTKGFISILIPLLLFASQCQCDTYDDDTTLEFYWVSNDDQIVYYMVQLYVDDEIYPQEWRVDTLPTIENPYTVPLAAQDGRKYQMTIQAVNIYGIAGPVSEMSDPVWCKLRSPGDSGSLKAGDADGNLLVSDGDLTIISNAWDTKRGVKSFDYRADLNYDDHVNILDMVIVMLNWGKKL